MKLYEQSSERQVITLTWDEEIGVSLLLDDYPQFIELTEYRYHECLAVAPYAFGLYRRVFIAGGGDGLAVARLLRIPGVERIVLCDYDPAVTALACEHPDLLRINDGSLRDERVTVVNDDAVAWLERSDEVFDLIICDFPDPYFPELGRLYTVELYELISRRLSPDGMMITQTLAVNEVSRIIRSTVRAAFPHEGHTRVCPGVGFTFGSKRPLVPSRPLPPWTLFLSDKLMGALFVLPKDLEAELDPSEEPPSRGDGERLIATALINALTDALSEQHAYRPDLGELVLTPDTVGRFTEEQGALLFRHLPDDRQLVVIVSERLGDRYAEALKAVGYAESGKTYDVHYGRLTAALMDGLRAAWHRLDDGSVAHLDALTARPRDNPEIGGLLARYLEAAADRFFDAPGSRADPDRPGRYVVTRDPAGEPVGFFKLLDREDKGLDIVELEILFGLGSPRQTLLSLILVLNYIVREGADAVEAFVPTGVFGRSLARLGAPKVDQLRVYVPA